MTTQSHDDVRAYYADLNAAAELGTVARILLGERITEEDTRLLKADCMNHASVSGASLHIELDKQLWRCWGCGVSGDVLQLVEFVQSGAVTIGLRGEMTESHRAARDWLADHVGMPKLSHLGLSADEIAVVEQRECSLRRARQVLTTAAAWYHERLLTNAEVMAWVQAQYGFTEETIRQFQIGYADLHGLRAHLYDQQFTADALLGCGLFLPNDAGHEDQVLPFFANRLMFPYTSRGQVVYFIGRTTPWTERNKYEDKRKYKKLFAHDPVKYPWIVEGIANDHLYNEDLLSTRPRTVVITEGITDCIALLAQGFPAISPVTVKFRREDTPRLISRLRGVNEVLICQDNEISQAGWQGALDTAQDLQEAGIPCRIAVLPLGEAQEQARAELQTRFGIEGRGDGTTLDTRLAKYTADERRDAQQLLQQAKIDVCQFFRDGGTAADFQAILQAAQSPLDLAIADLTATTPLRDQQAAVESILRQIARQPMLLQSTLLQAVRGRLGNAIGMTELRRMLKAAEQGTHAEHREQQRRQAATAPEEETVVCDDGQKRLSLVKNGIVRQTVRETAQGPVVTRTTISNCHVRLTRDVVTVEPADVQDGTSFTKRDFYGRLIGETWEAAFTIDAMRWPLNTDLASHITKAGGVHVLLETGPWLDDIRRVAFHLSTDIEHSTVYRMFGYHPTEGFISPTLTIREGEIVPSASRNLIVDVGAKYNKAQNLDLAPATEDEVRDVIRHLLTDYLRIRPYPVTLPIFAHAFAGPVLFGSPLIEVGYTPFILFIGGASGKGKTETARLAQCLWGDFPTKERMAGFGSTTTVNRQEAARCIGGLWVIDDYKRQKVVNEAQMAAENMFTDYADMQSRKKGTPGAKVISSLPIKCMLLVTAEDAALSQTAALARSLQVDFCQEGDTTAIYQRCQAMSSRYRTVMAPFIAWWQRQDHQIWLTRAVEIREMFLAKLQAQDISGDNTMRLVGNATLSLLALEVFQAWCVHLGIHPQDLTGFDLSVEYSTILDDMLVKMHRLVGSAKPGLVFLHILAQLLLSGRVYLLDGTMSADPLPGAKRIGQYRWQEGAIDIFSSVVMSEVRDMYRRSEEHNLIWSTQAIGKQLAEEGYLCDGADEHRGFQKRARVQGEGRDGKPVYVWRIRKDRFDEVLAEYKGG